MKPVKGIMKLAKLDFLLRYPRCLRAVLENQGRKNDRAKLEKWEEETIESKMIRFRYGPWDKRYRRWVSMLAAKGLVTVSLEGRSVLIQLTEKGKALADRISGKTEFMALSRRSQVINTAVRVMGCNQAEELYLPPVP